MAAEKIGEARCPLCGTGGARVSLSKAGLACLTCNGCNCQLFTRSGRSDELVRALIAKTPASAPEPAPAPTPPTTPAAPAAAPTVPVAAPARRGFGFFA